MQFRFVQTEIGITMLMIDSENGEILDEKTFDQLFKKKYPRAWEEMADRVISAETLMLVKAKKKTGNRGIPNKVVQSSRCNDFEPGEG